MEYLKIFKRNTNKFNNLINFKISKIKPSKLIIIWSIITNSKNTIINKMWMKIKKIKCNKNNNNKNINKNNNNNNNKINK